MTEHDLELDLDDGRYDFASFGGIPGALVPGSTRGTEILSAPIRTASAGRNPLGSATPFARTKVALNWTPTEADMAPWPGLHAAMFGGASTKNIHAPASHAPGVASAPSAAWSSRGLRNATALGGHAFPAAAHEAEAAHAGEAGAAAAEPNLAASMAQTVEATKAAGGPAALELDGSPFEAAVSPFGGNRSERRAGFTGADTGAPREAKAGPNRSPFDKHGGRDGRMGPLHHQAYLPAPLTDHMHTVTAKGRKTGAAQYH